MSTAVRYLLFDVESVADGGLLNRIEYPDESFSDQQAIDDCRKRQLEKTGREFIPYTFQFPVAIAIAKIADDLTLIDLKTLDEGQFRPHVITRDFWSGWRYYRQQSVQNGGKFNLTLVSFNGRSFDIPLLELAAFRYGIDIGDWVCAKGSGYEQPRNRYNTSAHLDLQEFITNFGTTRFNGGLNLLANLLGNPGKMGIAGHMVQDLYTAGQLKQINDYCRCDVLDTYFVFLRAMVVMGKITLEREAEITLSTCDWLREQAADDAVYEQYLQSCSNWTNPWQK
jgi:hypothetical protein